MSAPTSEHVIVWEFRVHADSEATFRKIYGPNGDWVRLFSQSDGHLGTTLLRDTTQPGRYLSIDRWKSAEAFLRFRTTYNVEYSSLDARCDSLTEKETPLGTWDTIGA